TERLFSAVVKSIADGLLLIGRDRTIAHANPAAERMLRCRLSELVGLGAGAFSRRIRVTHLDGAVVHPDEFLPERFVEEGGPLHEKMALHRRDGEDLVISSTAAAVRDDVEGPPEAVVNVMHDITAAEHLEGLRDDIFARTAHAIKTPVAIIKANVQV